MPNLLYRAGRAGGRILESLAALLLLSIVLLTLTEVTIRYLIGGSLPWTEEVSLLLWTWMIQIAAVRASHMRIEFFVEALPPLPRAAIRVGVALVSIGLLLLLTWGALRMIDLTRYDYLIAVPWLSVSLSYWAVVVAAPLWILSILAGALHPGEESAAESHLA